MSYVDRKPVNSNQGLKIKLKKNFKKSRCPIDFINDSIRSRLGFGRDVLDAH